MQQSGATTQHARVCVELRQRGAVQRALHELYVGVQAVEGGCVSAGQLLARRDLQVTAVHQQVDQLPGPGGAPGQLPASAAGI